RLLTGADKAGSVVDRLNVRAKVNCRRRTEDKARVEKLLRVGIPTVRALEAEVGGEADARGVSPRNREAADRDALRCAVRWQRGAVARVIRAAVAVRLILRQG